MDFKILWLKKKKFSKRSRHCDGEPLQPADREDRSDRRADPGMFMTGVQSNTRWGYQPGAAPQQSLHRKFSSQAFSSASAFLPWEGPHNNWKQQQHWDSVRPFKDYQVNDWEGEKWKGSSGPSQARAHSIQTAPGELKFSLCGQQGVPTCLWRAHSSSREYLVSRHRLQTSSGLRPGLGEADMCRN